MQREISVHISMVLFAGHTGFISVVNRQYQTKATRQVRVLTFLFVSGLNCCETFTFQANGANNALAYQYLLNYKQNVK